jgi:hypothetical protein
MSEQQQQQEAIWGRPVYVRASARQRRCGEKILLERAREMKGEPNNNKEILSN